MCLLRIALAGPQDRAAIYRLRYRLFARETGRENADGILTDGLDAANAYVAAFGPGDEPVGFISVTPPGPVGYSFEKYVPRSVLPLAAEEDLYELRILGVDEPYRGTGLPLVLIYAAFRYVKECGGCRVAGLARAEILDVYRTVGLTPVGPPVQIGEQTCHLVTDTVSGLWARRHRWSRVLRRLGRRIEWGMGFPFDPDVPNLPPRPA